MVSVEFCRSLIFFSSYYLSIHKFFLYLYILIKIQYTKAQEENRCFEFGEKIFKDNHMLADTTICDGGDDSRTHKVFHALDEICYQFDLSKPIWLESNIREFKRHAKTRFRQDSFVDEVDFDFLEFQVIEED